MSIWKDADSNTGGNYEVEGGSPIPDNTNAHAYIKDATWKEYEGERYINIQWGILKPDEFKNRVVFQKLKVNESDRDKRIRAINMLYAIDFNAGVTLPKSKDPTDTDLAKCLQKAMMGIKIKKWEMEGREGNWIAAVAASKKSKKPDPVPVDDPDVEDDIDDDDIPF